MNRKLYSLSCLVPLGIGGCLGNGLLDLSTLKEKALLLGSHHKSVEKTQWVFPSIEFRCETMVTAIHYATLNVSDQRGASMHPKFQIWRKNPMSPHTYTKHDISGSVATLDASIANVFTYSSIGLSVQSGDILGAYQPAEMKSKTFLTFQNDSGFMSYFKEQKKPPPMFDTANAEAGTDFLLLSVETTGLM